MAYAIIFAVYPRFSKKCCQTTRGREKSRGYLLYKVFGAFMVYKRIAMVFSKASKTAPIHFYVI